MNENIFLGNYSPVVMVTPNKAVYSVSAVASPSSAGNASVSIDMGERGVMFRATADVNSGYIFDGWTISGADTTLSDAGAISAMGYLGNSDAVLTAKFLKEIPMELISGDKKVDISFSEISGAVSYSVANVYSPSTYYMNEVSLYYTTDTAGNFSFGDLTNGKTYYYAVYAYNSSGKLIGKSKLAAVVPNASLKVPEGIGTSLSAPVSGKYSWQKKSGNTWADVGCTTKTLRLISSSQSGQYRCIITTSGGTDTVSGIVTVDIAAADKVTSAMLRGRSKAELAEFINYFQPKKNNTFVLTKAQMEAVRSILS